MNWLNLQVSVGRSPEFIGCEPTQRSTWLSLLLYCVDQENGGIIPECKPWKDRRWQQTASVTREEVGMECDLFWFDGEDLHIAFYPSSSEDQVKKARNGGSKGGRPKKNPLENPPQNPGVIGGVTETITPPKTPSETSPKTPLKTQREDKIREGNEIQHSPLPPPGGGESGSGVIRNPDLDALKARINSLKDEWQKPSRWNYSEDHMLTGGSAAQMQELNDEDWNLLKRYLNARVPEGAGYWQPRSRQKFTETFSGTFADAMRWKGKERHPEAKKHPPSIQSLTPISREALSEIFNPTK